MKYRTIVADPPWKYDGFASMPDMPFPGAREKAGQPTGLRAVVTALPYPSMSLDAIEAIGVNQLADMPSRLFLWTTNHYLPAALNVLAAWGFTYRQTLVWYKTGNPSPFGGSVAPNHAEFLLVGVRGAPVVSSRLASSVIPAPKPNKGHSQKPECFLDYIEQVSPGPYLELFARRNRLGWDTWGNEALNHIDLSAHSQETV